jgi:hypothetical protein
MKTKLQEQTELYFKASFTLRRTSIKNSASRNLLWQNFSSNVGAAVSHRLAHRIGALSVVARAS